MVDTCAAGEERERQGGCTQQEASQPLGGEQKSVTKKVPCMGRGCVSVRQTADAHSREQRGITDHVKQRN
jgi:hypothetical protein